MFSFIYALLFLKPSVKAKHIPAQIIRYIIGLIVGFFVFWMGLYDKSLSFILASLWIPAIVQIIGFAIESSFDDEFNGFQIGVCTVASLAFIVSLVYNWQPYISGNADKLAKMVQVTVKEDKISKTDPQHIIIIAPETAYYEMQTQIGTLDNPSMYKVGKIGTTMYNGQAVYVAPIEFEGFSVALGKDHIPGVMIVSAEKLERAKVIQIPSKRSDSMMFSDYLERYIRNNKPSAILFDANVELNEKGEPYYVASYGHYNFSRTGSVIDGVLLYSFQDDKVTDYAIDKVPDWVDEVWPSTEAEEYNGYYGTLQQGWINSWWGKKGIQVPTKWDSTVSIKGLEVNSSEVTGVIDYDGKMKWFTDFTNTSDTSTTMTGYSMMDMETGKVDFYKTSGYINGKGAMNAVVKTLGAQGDKWAPTQPILYNLFGYETWVVPIVNKADGSYVKVAAVIAKNSYVIVEDDKDRLIDSLKNAIAYGKIEEGSNAGANSTAAKEKIVQGEVERINAVMDILYVKLKENDKIFMVTKSAGYEGFVSQVGDKVEIKYMDVQDSKSLSVTSFKNITLWK